MKLKELEEKINDIKITYDYEGTYSNLYNAVIDYENETQDWDIDYLFQDIVTYDVAEDIARNELEKGGLVRLYYFLGDANCNNDIFKIDGYGNLQDIDKDDLEMLKNDILYLINKKKEEE